MKKYYCALVFLAVAALGQWCCTNLTVAGGSSSTDNGRVLGTIYRENGLPARNTQVTLLPAGADPYRDTSGTPRIDTTNAEGDYAFGRLPPGNYTLQAVALDNRTRALVGSVVVDSAITFARVAQLAEPGAIKVRVQNGPGAAASYVYVPGTSFFGVVRNGTGIIDSLPAGSIIPAVRYAEIADPSKTHVIKTDVTLVSGAVLEIADYSAWKYSKKLFLNTTMNGADVSGSVFRFPVLVRLSNANFDFTQALPDGGDLRCKKSDDTPLAYEIERWDATAQRAEIWVRLDTVYGSDSTRFFTLCWGNPTVTSESDGTTVFDTSAGFQAVWHLSGEGPSLAHDATANQCDGAPYNMTAASGVQGAIGGARSFNGSSSYISMLNTAAGKLDFPQNGSYTMSLWMYADTIDSIWHAIAGKGHEQYYMQFKCFGGNRASYEFVEFQDQRGWQYTEDSISPNLGSKKWLYLVGVRSGSSQRLYLNGAQVINSPALMAGAYARNSGDDFAIGRFGRSVSIPYFQGWSYFKGSIDEVRVSRGASGADWIRLCYMNQKTDDALVVFDK